MKKNSKKVLLHACCAICSGYPLQNLWELGYEPVIYFYNPNIQPKEEYLQRLDAQKKLCEEFGCELIIEDYNSEIFNKAALGFEKEPEGGKRCKKCFEIRLSKTAEKAKELDIEEFTTSIVISPHKNYELISKIGKTIAEKYDISYLNINFKKKDGFLKTNKIAKDLNLYRQNYCGCLFSLNNDNL